jgi:general secretion pathway protein D
MKDRFAAVASLVLLALLATGCPKGRADFKQGQQAEFEKDYDTALIHYERALKADPRNSQYELRVKRIRFEAAQMHVDRGHKLRDQGLLEPAAAEFEKALALDPSSFIAEQEIRRTLDMIVEQREKEARAAAGRAESPPVIPLENVPSGPPELQPLSREPLNLQMTEDSKKIFETIGRLAGINVIFDTDFQPRRVTVELQQATLEQALDIVALITKTFWKPVTTNTIMVIPDSAAKRRSYEEQIIKTFYLSNTVEAAELNEIVQTLRTLLDIKRITPSTANNAVIIRDTPDKVAVAEKIIHDIDQAKPEVLVQVAVLQARRDRARELGIVPSTSIPVVFTPREAISTSVGGDTSFGGVPLSELGNVGSQDYSIVLPSATAMALLTDATTKVIQNPEVRVTDGQTAKLRVGDRVPFAVGSFQPGIGGVGVNPLVNTQFQFQDVGVNLDITPRVHSNREISLKVKVEISSVTGQANIGGVQQPIFGQRIVEHDIRLREGEVSILGGIIERNQTVTIQGWPGLSQIPFLRYLFSSEKKTELENEVLVALTPRIIRLPAITPMNLRPLAVGTDENVSLPRAAPPPPETPAGPPQPPAPPSGAPAAAAPTPGPAAPAEGAGGIGFEPAAMTVKTGDRFSVDVLLTNVQDAFAIPLAVGYDPQVLELSDVQLGSFLGGAEQPPALVHRVDPEAGTAIISVSRAPGSAGASGTGTLVTLVFTAKAPGRSPLTINNVAPRNSQRELINLRTGVGEVEVQ